MACANFGQVTAQIVFELVFVDSHELFHINFLRYVFLSPIFVFIVATVYLSLFYINPFQTNVLF